ncbi:MAG: hypothetical protein JNJ69_11470 [Leptospiraceae bacterium]|nr:hypothetical protein [Leptospiraceae bacterium]
MSSDEQSLQVDQLRKRWQKRFVARKAAMAAVQKNTQKKTTLRLIHQLTAAIREKAPVSIWHTQGAAAAILIIAFGVWYFSDRKFEQGTSVARVFQMSKPVLTKSANASALDAAVPKSQVIADRDEIILDSENVTTDFSTTFVVTQAKLQLREYRDGVGIQIESGELLMDFDPVEATKRYIIIPNRAVIKITGTQVYARVTSSKSEVYLRHGKADMETADGKSRVLMTGYAYDLGNNQRRAVSRDADEQLMRVFSPIRKLPKIGRPARSQRNPSSLDFEEWRRQAGASQSDALDLMLKKYPFVFKAFLPNGKSAFLGAFDENPATVYGPEGRINLTAHDQGKIVRLK